MDNSASDGQPDLYEVVREALHAISEAGPAGIQPLAFPPNVPRCRVGSPAAVRARLRDFVAACRPIAGAWHTLGASGFWTGRRVTVIRLTLSSSEVSGNRQGWSLHVPIGSENCEKPLREETRRSTPLGRKRRVLIVDDEPVSRRLTTRLVQGLGCETTAVDNGTKAIELATSGAFDVIFMDCDMPHLSGYETTDGIRRTENIYTPIVAVTATTPAGWPARVKCLQAGMDDYLPKPVALTAIKCALEWWAPIMESHAS